MKTRNLQYLYYIMNMKEKIKVLYIDDEVNNLVAFKASFRRLYHIYTTSSTMEARRILDENDIQVIISDQRMPEMTGIEFFESILEEHPEPIRMLLTGYSDMQAVIDAINKGHVYRYFSKPWDEKNMIKNINKASDVYFSLKEQKEMTSKLLDVNRKIEFLLRQKLLS